MPNKYGTHDQNNVISIYSNLTEKCEVYHLNEHILKDRRYRLQLIEEKIGYGHIIYKDKKKILTNTGIYLVRGRNSRKEIMTMYLTDQERLEQYKNKITKSQYDKTKKAVIDNIFNYPKLFKEAYFKENVEGEFEDLIQEYLQVDEEPI